MSKELCLLRHGKAAIDEDDDDFHRPLTKRGSRDARNMGAWMRHQHWSPDFILSSPAVRALSTAAQAAQALGIDAAAIKLDQRLYFQGIAQIKSVLATVPSSAKRILLVGHNPDLEALLLDLAASEDVPQQAKLMPTATLVRLQLPDQWQQLPANCAKLLSITLAKQLPDIK